MKKRYELSSQTPMTRFDARELFNSQEAIWAAEEQKIRAEY